MNVLTLLKQALTRVRLAFATASDESAKQAVDTLIDTIKSLSEECINMSFAAYSDSKSLSDHLRRLFTENKDPVPFLKKIVEINPQDLSISDQANPNNIISPTLFSAIQNVINAYEAVPERIQPIVKDLIPNPHSIWHAAHLSSIHQTMRDAGMECHYIMSSHGR